MYECMYSQYIYINLSVFVLAFDELSMMQWGNVYVVDRQTVVRYNM